MKDTQIGRSESYALFMSALEVVNESLQENRDNAAICPLLKNGRKALAEKHFGVALYRDNPEVPLDYFMLRLTGGRFELLSHGKESPDIAWKVSNDFLRDVVDNPQDYINDPAKLDLELHGYSCQAATTTASM